MFHELSNQGYRVLAVAYRAVERRDSYSADDESKLVLAGYLAFADPPRADTASTVAALRQDGVQIKIITGDNELVTRHICEQVGIDTSRIVLGSEIVRMTDAALQHVVEEATVFARVSPAQKNRIILALKHRSHVVGYMGDGINDAPSLHAADVGISVEGAVDVARDAADIILVEPGLGVLHAGILEGRKASGNVLKYLLMGTSSNFGNMLSMACASLFLPFLPMLPTQILLNNFLYDLAQITIPTDTVDPGYLRQPQHWDISLIRNFMVLIGPISSIFDFLTFFVLLRYFHASQAEFHTGWFVESLATQALVLFVIRTFGNPLKSKPSGPLTATVLLIVLVGILIPFSPTAKCWDSRRCLFRSFSFSPRLLVLIWQRSKWRSGGFFVASQWLNLSGPLTAAPPQFVCPNPLTLASAGGRSRLCEYSTPRELAVPDQQVATISMTSGAQRPEDCHHRAPACKCRLKQIKADKRSEQIPVGAHPIAQPQAQQHKSAGDHSQVTFDIHRRCTFHTSLDAFFSPK